MLQRALSGSGGSAAVTETVSYSGSGCIRKVTGLTNTFVGIKSVSIDYNPDYERYWYGFVSNGDVFVFASSTQINADMSTADFTSVVGTGPRTTNITIEGYV